LNTLKVITSATTEPLTLEEAKLHLKVETDADDSLITSLITAARETAEIFTGRALASQVLEYILDGFPAESETIYIPRPPLEEVESIKYRDYEGNETVWDSSNYIVDADSMPARVTLAYGKYFPDFTPYPVSSVRIRYTAGYKSGGPDSLKIPEEIKQALKLLIGHFYENRESVVVGTVANKVPFSVEALLYPFRVSWW
jgi:uncharacterized phiE125 gp8 family phage protein